MSHRVSHSLYGAVLLLASLAGCDKQDMLKPVGVPSDKAARLSGEDQPAYTIQKGKYIIISATNALPANLEAEVKKARGTLGVQMKQLGLVTASSDDPNFVQKIEQVAGIRSVIYNVRGQFIEPASESMATGISSKSQPGSAQNPSANPMFYLQWPHKAIHSPEAWAAGYQGAGAKVAIIDTGFDLEHEDLKENIIYSTSFVPWEGPQYVQYYPGQISHGTHVAGIVAAADNNAGVIGVAPKAKLLLIKVLSDELGGFGYDSWIIEGILDAVAQQADIINLSLGSYRPRNGRYLYDNGTPDDSSDDFVIKYTRQTQEEFFMYSRAISYARQRGVTIVAGAGNNATNGNQDQTWTFIPAGIPGVLAISATAPIGWAIDPTTNLDNLASYSNYGTPAISFAAPGGDRQLRGTTLGDGTCYENLPCWNFDRVLSLENDNNYIWLRGTSMATPYAAGVAALIIGKNGGSMDPVRVEAALRASADDLGQPGRDPVYGHGRVNAARAVGVSY